MKYIDLDGVLANLNEWLVSVNPKGVYNEKTFNEIALKHYDKLFLESKPIRENFKLVEGDYRILTALPNLKNYIRYGLKMGLDLPEIIDRHNQLYRNKILWCEANGILASNVIVVEARKLKSSYANCLSGVNVLYDDSPHTIKEWEAAGGIGVLIKPVEVA